MKRPGTARTPSQAIDAAFQTLLEAVSAHCPDAHPALVRDVFEIAERCHSGQKRRSGDPYVLHP